MPAATASSQVATAMEIQRGLLCEGSIVTASPIHLNSDRDRYQVAIAIWV
jgi:hypothetical protein